MGSVSVVRHEEPPGIGVVSSQLSVVRGFQSQGDGYRYSRFVAIGARGVSLPGEVVGEHDVAGAEVSQRAVAEPDFYLAGQRYNELSARAPRASL